jgi:ABC-type glycerol-3-phosphate transport system substrate-binding protein
MNGFCLVRCCTAIFASTIVLLCVGCPKNASLSPDAKATPTDKKPLVVLVADDPPLAEAISREWRGRTEEELIVREVKLSELTGASRLPGDTVIVPCGALGELAERGLIVPLDSQALEDSDFHYRDIFDQIRLKEIRWGGQTFAAPLGSPQLLLCYRSDVFEKLGLSPPTDWTAYQQVVERLAANSMDGGLQAAIEPLAEGWTGQLLLARAASYAMHRDQVSPLFRLGTCEPLIDQPPYVRALEELVSAAKSAGTSGSRLSPEEAFRALAQGKCAMAVTWPPAGASGESPAEHAGKLAFAALPAGQEAYRFATKSWEPRDLEEAGPVPLLSIGGRIAVVSASTQDKVRATGFVLWLSGRDVSEHVGPHSSAATLFRQSHIARSERWTPLISQEESRGYAETLAGTLSAPRVMPGLTLPGRDDYLAALDKAVYAALDGKPAIDALKAASERWREITKKIGNEAQLKALEHSLGQGGPQAK